MAGFDWGSAIGGLASLGSAYIGSQGAKDAGRASAAGSEAGNKVIWDMFQQNRADQQPFMQAGLAGMNEYMQMLGLSPASMQSAQPAMNYNFVEEDASGIPIPNQQLYASNPEYRQAWDSTLQQHRNQWKGKGYWHGSDNEWIRSGIASKFQMPAQQAQAPQAGTGYSAQQITDKLRATPGYGFRFGEGQRAVESSASAQSGLFSGKAAKALTRYGQGVADQSYGDYMNRLASLAGLGQTATNTVGGWGQNAASGVATGLQNAGNARASGLANSASQWQQGMGDAAYFGGKFGQNQGWWG